MNKGLIRNIVMVGILLLAGSAGLSADIWKVVDENGNVVYTDQKPSDGSPPMDLPELSVIETDYAKPEILTGTSEAGEAAGDDPTVKTPRELRRMYRDFQISRPMPDETFWGTGNTVIVSWGSATPFEPGLTAKLHVDGQSQAVPPEGNMTVTLDRGEHQVYAELLDTRGRRITTTDSVTFHVKQHSQNFARPAISPGGG
jgi:hypothetical protein